jgi:hypothetical protein
VWLCDLFCFSHLAPDLESDLHCGAVLLRLHAMPSRLEVIGEGAKGGEKTLRMPC